MPDAFDRLYIDQAAGGLLAVPLPPPPPSREAIGVITGKAMRDILARRIEQIDAGGFGPRHDAQIWPGALVHAALTRVQAAVGEWDHGYPRRAPEIDVAAVVRPDLIEAAVLIWAAIDRLDAQPAPANETTAAAGEESAA